MNKTLSVTLFYHSYRDGYIRDPAPTRILPGDGVITLYRDVVIQYGGIKIKYGAKTVTPSVPVPRHLIM